MPLLCQTNENGPADGGSRIAVRRLDRVAVYGRSNSTVVYELLGMAGAMTPAWVEDYEAGLAAYEGRRWDGSIQLFEARIANRGGDRPSELMITRCSEVMVSPPGPDWQPVVIVGEK